MEEALEALTNLKFISAIVLTLSMIAIGFFFTKKKIFNDSSVKTLTALVMKIALPALAFCGFMADFSFEQIAVLIFSLIAYILLFLITRLIFIKVKDNNVYRCIFVIGQVTLFGLPLAKSLFGSEILASTNMIVFVFRLFLYIYSYLMISNESINHDNLKQIFKKTLLNPIMIAMMLGLIIFLTQKVMPKVEIDGVSYSILRLDKTLTPIYQVLSSIGDLSVPLGMLLVGMILGNIEVKKEHSNKMSWFLSLARSLIAPLMVMGMILVWNLIFKNNSNFIFSQNTIVTIIICFASPVSISLNTMCVEFHNHEGVSSTCVFISTIMSVVAIPLLIFLANLIF